jgi:hypothetical protein
MGHREGEGGAALLPEMLLVVAVVVGRTLVVELAVSLPEVFGRWLKHLDLGRNLAAETVQPLLWLVGGPFDGKRYSSPSYQLLFAL